MRFSKNEYIAFSAAAVIILAFSFLFYFDFTGRSALGQERIVGSITYKKQVAQRKYSSQVVWEEIDLKSPVYNNDAIRTADQSEAVVRLADGTEIAMNENSMIILSFATNEIDIQFKGGSISAKRGDLGGDALSTLNIKSGETTVSMAKSDVQVSSGKEKEMKLTVNKGEAKIKSGDKERDIKENQKVVVSEKTNEVTVYSLPLKQLSPLPDSMIVISGEADAVQFSWEKLKPEQKGVLEIAKTASFKRPVATGNMAGNTISIKLPQGSYYWRLRAKNRISGKTDVTDDRKFTIIREVIPHLVYPVKGQLFQYTEKTPVISFKWNGSDVTQEYQLVIASDAGMSKIVKSYQTKDTIMAVEALEAGAYYWQITSLIAAGEKTYRLPSEIRRVEISRMKIVSPPTPQFPPDNESVNTVVLKDKGIIFSWEKTADIPETRLIVSKSADFKSIVFAGQSRTNFLNIRKELKPGIYYWRVTGMLPDKRFTDPSSIQRFTVTPGGTIRLLTPADRSAIKLESGAGSVRFSWEKPGIYGESAVQISADPKFSRIEKEERVTGTNAAITGFKEGTYHWRVVLRSSDGNVILTSRQNTLVITMVLSQPYILYPANGEFIDITKLKGLDLRWKRLGAANLYRVRFYRMEDNKATFITEREIRNTAFGTNDMSFLGEGRFLWTVQAFETSEDGSSIIRKSTVSRSYFDVGLPENAKRIKLKSPRILYVE
jgi:hypothetical protein